MNPAQCRAARALLDWSQIKLAGASGVSLRSIIGFEHNRRPVSEELIAELKAALEQVGIQFTCSGGFGVKLTTKSA